MSHVHSTTETIRLLAERKFDRTQLETVLAKRFFYAPSFQLYGGVAGLYDYGPPGCALQANLMNLWRQHFVLEEDMLEVDCTIMTPAEVLKTSGHVEKFADWMCRDVKTMEVFRADHLVEAVLEARLEGDVEARRLEGEAVAVTDNKKEDPKKKKKKLKSTVQKLDPEVRKEYEDVLATIDNYTGPELGKLVKKFGIVSPETGNELTDPVEFNLMFESSIGPTGQLKGYLRPETAQGQFLNFKRLLEFNNGAMPFASASIGRSFRNEISPRSGLLRVREFNMAEIEHFVDPEKKDHPKFGDVADLKLRFLSSDIQLSGSTEPAEMTIGEAVASGMVDNKTLGYFLGRIYLFLRRVGVHPMLLRFRQHLRNEMAHYACDCWDAEILTSYGWIECVGCADRSAYDLTVHSRRTKEKLVVREPLKEPREVDRWEKEINRKVFGPKLKKANKAVEEIIESWNEEELAKAAQGLESNGFFHVVIGGETHVVDKEMIQIKLVRVKENVREYVPNVIEPSFGLGRILYSIMEHSWWTRAEDEQRGVLSFPVCMAPTKCLVQPLSSNVVFEPLVKEAAKLLRRANISNRVDNSSASVGKTYARNDELGTPFGITIDFQSVKDGTVTLRERDSTQQIREKLEVIVNVVKALVEESTTWSEVMKTYPVFVQQEVDEE